MPLRRGLAAAATLVVAAAASAHIVYGRPSLHLLVAEAELVARARVLEAATAPAGAGGEGRPAVTAELLEVFKGDAPLGPVRFAQHGHGVARFEPGEEALLFLRRVEAVRELSDLDGTGVEYVSLQEHDTEFPLAGADREALFSALRSYVRVETLPGVQARGEALRRVTVDLLTSGDARLAQSALSDLVLASQVPLVGEGDLTRLMPLLFDAAQPIGLRAGLLAELVRRRLVEGPPAWVRLLETADAASLPAAARAAGTHPSPEVTARLVVLLSSGDAAVAEAAAIALGNPGHAPASARLARCLDADAPRLRMAAIRGLGGMGSPEALVALAEAAARHPDPATRRRAAAEAARLAGR